MIERTFRELTDDVEQERALWAARLGRTSGPTWDDILKSQRILLVSEAGVGKTYECQKQAERLWEAGEPAFYIDLAGLKDNDLRQLLSPEEEQRFDQWLVAQADVATFFLDSIDELELTLGKFDSALKRFAKPITGHLQRARIVVTSRPIPIDEQVFRKRLPLPRSQAQRPTPEDFADIATSRVSPRNQDKAEEVPAWRNVALVPLTDEQIGAMADSQGVKDTAAFLADLQRRDAMDFARRPQDLIELCADWNAQLQVRTHAEQVASNVEVKLRPRTDRAEKAALSDEKALDGARQLALAALLSRNLTIRHSATADRADGVEVALEPAKILPGWSATERATLLERPLFGFATYGRVRFHHRSVIEFLAAEELFVRLQRRMPRASVRRLLFTETAQGETVVRPIMRPVAAWLARRRDDIFEQLRDIEPSVLLNFGDPASLRPQQRIEALSAYVERYGPGGWRGMHTPHLQVRRFASRDQGPEICRLWATVIENCEVRQLLIELIGDAKIARCADIAWNAAMNSTNNRMERLLAIEALIQLDDARLANLCDAVETDRALWPNRLARSAIARLFPSHLTSTQLCRSLSTINEPSKMVGELTFHLPRTILANPITSQELDALRSGLEALIMAGTSWSQALHRAVCERRDLVAMLLATCLRLWRDITSPSVYLIVTTVRALQLSSREMRNEEFGKELRLLLAESDASVRAAIFWGHDAFLQSIHPRQDAWGRLYDGAVHGAFELAFDKDWDWVIEALADASRTQDDRRLALEAALWLVRGLELGPRADCIETLASLTTDDGALAHALKQAVTPKPLDPRWAEMEERRARKEERRQSKEDADHHSWVAFWTEVAENPDHLFGAERAQNTAWDLWQAMSKSGEESRSSGWNRRFIEEHFSKDTADRLRSAMMAAWRNDRPTLVSEREEGERNTYFIRWQLGLAGVAAEAEDPEWASKLTSDEAELAARYAPIELNGYPSWLEGLAVAHPESVDAILGTELTSELGGPVNHDGYSILVQNVSHAAAPVVALFLPRLHRWLIDQGDAPTDQAQVQAYARRLAQILDILIQHGHDGVRSDIRDRAAQALSSGFPRELAGVWLPVLFELDPKAGVAAFERILSALPVKPEGEAVAWFSQLFGRHGDSVVNLGLPGFTPPLVLSLLRLAYTHVRPDDDLAHEGMYSPDTRDDAQSGRNNILSRLLNFRCEAGWAAKVELANDPLAAHFRDRLIALAKEAAAEEADGVPFTYEQLAALERGGEAPPANRDATFALMRDRLDDLEDLLLQDISPREGWATMRDERLLRRGIAHELRNIANGCYTVDQEGVTADEKETDIRLRSTVSLEQGTIELKVGESWSGRELRDALRKQLVERYMAAESCRSGCLLITVASGRTWDHPDTGEKLDFAQLITWLDEEAAQIAVEFAGSLRLMVKGLDLRPRLSTQVAERRGRGRNAPDTSAP